MKAMRKPYYQAFALSFGIFIWLRELCVRILILGVLDGNLLSLANDNPPHHSNNILLEMEKGESERSLADFAFHDFNCHSL